MEDDGVEADHYGPAAQPLGPPGSDLSPDGVPRLWHLPFLGQDGIQICHADFPRVSLAALAGIQIRLKLLLPSLTSVVQKMEVPFRLLVAMAIKTSLLSMTCIKGGTPASHCSGNKQQ